MAKQLQILWEHHTTILIVLAWGFFLILSFVGPIVILILLVFVGILIVNGLISAFKKRTIDLKEITQITFKSFPPTEILPRLFGLMAVIAVVSIFLMSILPGILPPPRLIDRAREGATKGNIGAIRGTLVIYYADNKGTFPLILDNNTQLDPKDKTRILSAFIPDYMEELPETRLKRDLPHAHRDSSKVAYIYINHTGIGPDEITNKGGWIYNPKTGEIRVNSTCKDTRGTPYYKY